MKKHIPNMITCCNLLCGAIATYMATQHAFAIAFALIILAAIFDFFDGFTARLLNVSSPIGKELDSLADNITFGLAPTTMLFCYLFPVLGWWSAIVFLMAAFSALRLAKFNLDERQTTSFIGLATPANAIFWGSLIASLAYLPILTQSYAVVLIVLSLISCWLLIAEIPMFSLKFKNASWTNNKRQFIFLIGAVIIIIALGITAICLCWTLILHAGWAVMIWYIALAIIPQK